MTGQDWHAACTVHIFYTCSKYGWSVHLVDPFSSTNLQQKLHSKNRAKSNQTLANKPQPTNLKSKWLNDQLLTFRWVLCHYLAWLFSYKLSLVCHRFHCFTLCVISGAPPQATFLRTHIREVQFEKERKRREKSPTGFEPATLWLQWFVLCCTTAVQYLTWLVKVFIERW